MLKYLLMIFLLVATFFLAMLLCKFFLCKKCSAHILYILLVISFFDNIIILLLVYNSFNNKSQQINEIIYEYENNFEGDACTTDLSKVIIGGKVFHLDDLRESEEQSVQDQTNNKLKD